MAKQTIPQLSASDREELIRKGGNSGDLLTAMRFLLIARLA
ncbi:MAG: hypothetical protein QM784_09470 [Polyangiaceae bacterium]